MNVFSYFSPLVTQLSNSKTMILFIMLGPSEGPSRIPEGSLSSLLLVYSLSMVLKSLQHFKVLCCANVTFFSVLSEMFLHSPV